MTESLKCHKESVWLILAQYSQLPRHGGKSSQEPGFSGLALAVTHASLEMLVTPLSLSLFKCAMGTILPVLMTPHVTVRICRDVPESSLWTLGVFRMTFRMVFPWPTFRAWFLGIFFCFSPSYLLAPWGCWSPCYSQKNHYRGPKTMTYGRLPARSPERSEPCSPWHCLGHRGLNKSVLIVYQI